MLTGADGRYSFTGIATGANRYALTASLTGFFSKNSTLLQLTVGQTVTFNFPLTVQSAANSWIIYGRITADSARGATLAGTLVVATVQMGTTSYSAISDNTGNYTIIIPNQAATYRILASRTGYISSPAVNRAVAAESTLVNITLQPAPLAVEIANPESKFVLLQNQPNPFRPATAISFHVSRAAQATLSVYNARGELIQNLANRQFSTGWHTVNWTARSLPAGKYFYKLRSGEFTAVKEMLLVK
jgi:hypothetical protein